MDRWKDVMEDTTNHRGNFRWMDSNAKRGPMSHAAALSARKKVCSDVEFENTVDETCCLTLVCTYVLDTIPLAGQQSPAEKQFGGGEVVSYQGASAPPSKPPREEKE